MEQSHEAPSQTENFQQPEGWYKQPLSPINAPIVAIQMGTQENHWAYIFWPMILHKHKHR